MKLMLLVYLLVISACTHATRTEPTLFSRIGGITVIEKVGDETLDIVSKDPKTARSFKDVKMKQLKASLRDFLCVKTGGDCIYEGETMKNSHEEAGITTAEFELMVQVLRERLNANGVQTKEKNELLKLLAPMKRDIVTK
jgi:hemoglobin